jgi:hypothetical protein
MKKKTEKKAETDVCKPNRKAKKVVHLRSILVLAMAIETTANIEGSI